MVGRPGAHWFHPLGRNSRSGGRAANVPSAGPDRAKRARRPSGRLTCASTPSRRVTGHAIHPRRIRPAAALARSVLSPAFSKLHDGRFCSLRLGQPQDDIAVILPGSAQLLELVNVGLLDIDNEATSRVSLRRQLVCALRKAPLDCGVGGRGDGDADHGSHPTTTERLRPEASIYGTPMGYVLARRRGQHLLVIGRGRGG
jgi:hypothetical protein